MGSGKGGTTQVTVRGEPKDLLINTVSIVPDPESQALYMFHCINCGSNIQQYKGRIAKIVPVLEPIDTAITIARCHKCGNYYNFQTHRGKPVEETTITLYTNPVGKSFFYCYAGRGTPMLTYTHLGIFSFVESKLMQPPFISHCNMPDCPEVYFFRELV